MAGGAGTRLKGLVGDLPKPMVQVCGKPLLEYQIENLVRYDITDVTIIISHTGGVIQQYFGIGDAFGANIKYIVEEKPLGTVGGLFMLDNKKNDVLILNGDLLFDVDFHRFFDFYKNQKNGSALLYVHPNTHPYDSYLCKLSQNKIIDWSKPGEKDDGYYHNLVNAGIHILPADVFKELDGGKKDLDRDILRKWVKEGRVFAYKSTEYIKDIGTPDRFAVAERDLKQGIIAAKNISKKQRAVFFDRDGTLNKKNGFIISPDQFFLNDGAAEAVKAANKNGFLAIVITNQPVIARGEATEKELDAIHMKLEMDLGKRGAYIDALFYCPHHPDKGFNGERADLKIHCLCRKPAPGLVLEAARKYNISLTDSYMIGDSKIDIDCGKNAGTKTVLIRTGENLYEQIRHIFTNQRGTHNIK